jgi:hypothetical protein
MPPGLRRASFALVVCIPCGCASPEDIPGEAVRPSFSEGGGGTTAIGDGTGGGGVAASSGSIGTRGHVASTGGVSTSKGGTPGVPAGRRAAAAVRSAHGRRHIPEAP